MPLTDKAKVLLIAPELATLTDAQFDLAIADAELEISSSRYGTHAERAARYLVAHLLTLSKRRGAGAIQQESIGPVSRMYAISVAADASSLSTTGYGAEFLRIKRQVLGGPLVS